MENSFKNRINVSIPNVLSKNKTETKIKRKRDPGELLVFLFLINLNIFT